MANMSLRDQNLDDLVANVQSLAAVGAADEVRSIMAVFARCTIEIADRARQLSEDVNHAKTVLGEQLGELTAQLKAASDQTSANINNAKQAFLPAVAELASEPKGTRLSITDASSTASQGTNALVRWTKALVIVTVVYALFTGGLLAVSFMHLRSVGSLSTPRDAQSSVVPGPPGSAQAQKGQQGVSR